MLPIAPVLEDIQSAFGLKNPDSVGVASETSILELMRNTTSRRPNVLPLSMAFPPKSIGQLSKTTQLDPGQTSGQVTPQRLRKGKEVSNSFAPQIETGPSSNQLRRFVLDWMSEGSRPKGSSIGSSGETLVVSTDSSEVSDPDEDYRVQVPLPGYQFDHEDLRNHLKTYKFNDASMILLESVVYRGRLLPLLNPTLFRDYPLDERFHPSRCYVYDVGQDGCPLLKPTVLQEIAPHTPIYGDSSIWQMIQVCSFESVWLGDTDVQKVFKFGPRSNACGWANIVRKLLSS
jgi:hypothetical protein